MGDYKQAYSDISKFYIDDIVPFSDLDQGRYDRNKNREAQWNDNWLQNKVNVNEIVNKFIIDNGEIPSVKDNNGVKYEFVGKSYTIICDKVAGYLRIWDNINEKFCELDGTPTDDINKTTHFKIKKREEM